MTYPAIQTAIDYLRNRRHPIPAKIAVLSRRASKALGDYQPVRDDLWAATYDAVMGYLSSNAQIPTYRLPMVTAVSQAYLAAADLAYVDGGGSLPLDDDTASWVRAELNAQFGYIDSLFETLKQLRKEEGVDAIHEAFRHADGYANSLDSLYNNVKAAGAGNKMLTFDGSDGRESCSDCQRYKGKRHRASWWRSHDAVPPNRGFECHGYHCAHRLYTDEGEEFTV